MPDNGVIKKIANRIIQKEKIDVLPIDIDSVANKYAKVEYYNIPFDFDGITIKKKGENPRIILNNRSNPQRQRFTLAHELGHIVIPWHIGTIIDKKTNEDNSFGDFEYREMEIEANCFAAEILLPDYILEKKINKFCKHLRSKIGIDTFITDIARQANTSLLTTIFKIFPLLPPNYLFIICNYDNRVLYSGKSEGTLVRAPSKDAIINPLTIFHLNSTRKEIKTDYYLIILLKFEQKASPNQNKSKEWRPILNNILDTNFNTQGEKKAKYQSLNARIGAFYGNVCKGKKISYDDFYFLLLQKLQGYNDLDWLYTDNDFIDFLSNKAYDLYSKQKN